MRTRQILLDMACWIPSRWLRWCSKLSDEFDVDISPVDITPENFKTVQTIYDMIQRLEDE